MAIPSGVILIWTGTNASIPSGWARETALDDKYPKGHGAENPNVTGGSNTHTHTSPAHSHTINGHTHLVSTSAKSSGNNFDAANNSSSGAPMRDASSHSHFNVPVTTINSGGGLSSVTSIYSLISNEPPYKTVIFVKPSGTVGVLVAGLVAHYNGTSVPNGYYYCNGGNGTLDLRNVYLKGASANGNAGGSGGSLTAHIHNLTHTHTETAHTHYQQIGGYSDRAATNGYYDSGGNKVSIGHAHIYSLASASAGGISSVQLTTAETNIEPAFKKMGLIQCSVPSMKLGMVALWLGTVANCPKNWVVCDGSNGTVDMRDKFIKIPPDLSTNGATGGANTHTHASQAHSHTGSSHTHSAASATDNHTNSPSTSTGGCTQTIDDSLLGTHNLTSITYTTVAWASANTSGNSANNQPTYRTVAYIQLNKLDLGGAMMMSKLM